MKKIYILAISIILICSIFLVSFVSAGVAECAAQLSHKVGDNVCNLYLNKGCIDPDSDCNSNIESGTEWLKKNYCVWNYNYPFDEGTTMCFSDDLNAKSYDYCYDDKTIAMSYIEGCCAFCKEKFRWMCMSCGVQDCDSLDTQCRDYHDVDRKCEGSTDKKVAVVPTKCYDPGCSSYTNYPYKTDCGGGNICDGNGNCGPRQCTSGLCCDGYNYRISSYKCAEDVTTEYGCLYGTALGSDVYVRHKDQYCSGSSASCTGTLLWDNWTISKDCNAGQFCKSGESACINATISSAKWTNLYLLDQSIKEAQVSDTVRLVSEGILPNNTQINFKIKKKGLILDSVVTTIPANFSGGKVAATWKISEEGKIYFEASPANYSSLMAKSDVLDVSKEVANFEPHANITFPNHDKRENYFFNTSYNINFTQASYDIDDPIITYLWDFGDGITSNDANPIHAYTKGGPKKVTLTVKDARGLNDTDKIEILIDTPNWNDHPLAVISHPKDGFTYAIGIVRCDGSKSIDAETPFENLKFRWYFNDKEDPDCSGIKGLKGAICNKFFETAGKKVIRLEVDDGSPASVSTATTTFFIAEEVEEAKEEAEEEVKAKEVEVKRIPYLTIVTLLIAALVVFLIARKARKAKKVKKRRKK